LSAAHAAISQANFKFRSSAASTMEPAAKRARISDGRAPPAASSSSAAAAAPPSQPLSTEMAAVNELMHQHPQEAKKMITAAEDIATEGSWK
jgi:hypothetical protein